VTETIMIAGICIFSFIVGYLVGLGVIILRPLKKLPKVELKLLERVIQKELAQREKKND